MSLEIKTSSLEPVRQTYAHIARRFGDKPATRYQEATYDAQATTNFHYRPMWNPDKTLNDSTYTVIKMQDWYDLKDPRQLYYGAYVQNRAKLQDSAESNYKFFEKRALHENLNDEVKNKVIFALIPLRHVEHTANLNFMYGSAYGYGTTITQACLYAGIDRLGIAQYLSRIGLLIDQNSAESLQQAKDYWLNDIAWQGIRAMCENMLIQKDWVELLMAQALVLDTVMHCVHYDALDQWLVDNGGRDVAMLTEFMQDCFKDMSGWSNNVIKTIVKESDDNKAQCQAWFDKWTAKVLEAYAPLISQAFEDSDAVNQAVKEALIKRAKATGLEYQG